MNTVLICIRKWSLSTCLEIDTDVGKLVHTGVYVCVCAHRTEREEENTRRRAQAGTGNDKLF